MEVDGPLQAHLLGAEALNRHGGERLSVEVGERAVDLARVERVQLAAQEALEVLADVGVQHADGAEGTGIAGHVDAFATKAARHVGAVHRPSATGGHHGETARCVAPFDGDVFDRVQQVLLQKSNDPHRRRFDRQVQRLGDLCRDRLACRLQVEGEAGFLVSAGAQPAENKLRVRSPWARLRPSHSRLGRDRPRRPRVRRTACRPHRRRRLCRRRHRWCEYRSPASRRGSRQSSSRPSWRLRPPTSTSRRRRCRRSPWRSDCRPRCQRRRLQSGRDSSRGHRPPPPGR